MNTRSSFFINFDKNQDNGMIFPVSCCMSLTVFGLFISMIALHLSGLASIPLIVSMNPKIFPSCTPNEHSFKFNRTLCSHRVSNISCNFRQCPSEFSDLITMLSTYTSMFLPNFPSKTLSCQTNGLSYLKKGGGVELRYKDYSPIKISLSHFGLTMHH